MWPASYWPASYWPASYWPKLGSTTVVGVGGVVLAGQAITAGALKGQAFSNVMAAQAITGNAITSQNL